MARKRLETLTEQMFYVLLSLRGERHGYGIMQAITHDKRMNDCLPPILFSAIFKLLKVLPDTELDAC